MPGKEGGTVKPLKKPKKEKQEEDEVSDAPFSWNFSFLKDKY